MTVSSSIRKAGPFAGNNVATTFPFNFKIFAKEDVKVLLVNPNGLSTRLVLDSDYSIQLNANQNSSPGGWVTYPISGTPLATSYQLVMLGDLAYDQETDITNGGGFYPNTIEDMSDRSTIQIQQLAEITSRALVITEAESTSPVLPNAQSRANSIVGFDALGNLEMLALTPAVGAGDLKDERFVDGTDYVSGTSTTITLSRVYGNKANLGAVVMQGVVQDPNSYALNNGNKLVFDAPIPLGVGVVWLKGGTTLSVYLPPAGSVGDTQLQWGNVLGRIVDSIVALRQLKSITYTRAFVTGYYAASDGGGGAYQYQPGDTTSADNGCTIIVGADGGRWYLQHHGSIALAQAGGKQDGATDDLAAWNRLLALPNIEITFTGTSLVSNQVTIVNSNTTIRGLTRNAGLLAKAGQNFQYVLFGSGLSNIQLRNFTVDANQANRASVLTTTGYCVLLTSCSGSLADGITVQNSIGTASLSAVGFQFGGVGSNNIIRNSFALNCGIAGKPSDGFYCSNDFSLLEGNTSINCFDTGHVLEACSFSTISACRSIGCGSVGAITNFMSTNTYGNQIIGLTGRDWNASVTGGVQIGALGTGNLCDTKISGLSMSGLVNAAGAAINIRQPSTGIVDGLSLDCSIRGGSAQGILVNGQNINIKANIQGHTLDGIQVQSGSNIVIGGASTIKGGAYGVTTRGTSEASATGVRCVSQSSYGLYAFDTSTLTSLMNNVTSPGVLYEGKDAGATLNRMTLVNGQFSIQSLVGSGPTGTLNNKFNVVDGGNNGKGAIPMYTA
ncbi:hypothetical protein SAMN05192564_11546 [Paraburkholderia sartisoli]|uniref:Right handed beta helix region n=1 Tax=Paraburkholderia sartisoli TaxID=83784 RepID=A0A1H4HSK7_9BURK|nr:hypothetical protein SAMN05192564_11546 [Paraburkholderia sartisoli]